MVRKMKAEAKENRSDQRRINGGIRIGKNERRKCQIKKRNIETEEDYGKRAPKSIQGCKKERRGRKLLTYIKDNQQIWNPFPVKNKNKNKKSSLVVNEQVSQPRAIIMEKRPRRVGGKIYKGKQGQKATTD